MKVLKNGTKAKVRECTKNGCLVKECSDKINVNNCTIVESWNQCYCSMIREKNGTIVRACRLKGRRVSVCPGVSASVVSGGNPSQTVTEESVTVTGLPAIFL